MSISVQSNQAALLALQNLNATSDKLQSTENRISTGLQVSSSKDNAAVWAIAQNQRSDIGSLSSVKMSLNRATSISDVSLAAGQTVSDLLVILREKIVAAMDTSQSAQSRTALDTDFKSILKQITQVLQNATFDNTNILDGTNTSVKFLSNADASTFITLQGQDMTLGGTIITLTALTAITTATLAGAALTQLDASMNNVNLAMATLGSDSRQIDAHSKFVTKLSDALELGVGHLVDADMARESAHLQALQVQQQLGAQSLSIANQSPQIVLSLFK